MRPGATVPVKRARSDGHFAGSEGCSFRTPSRYANASDAGLARGIWIECDGRSETLTMVSMVRRFETFEVPHFVISIRDVQRGIESPAREVDPIRVNVPDPNHSRSGACAKESI